jgi:hypothetical protein
MSGTTKKLLFLVIVWLVASIAGDALADDRATAEKHFRAGAKAYAAQSFEAAAAQFEEAYRALPLPEIAFSTAQAYRKLYRVDAKPQYVKRAVELYRVYLEKVKKGGRVGDAADSLGEMERELARLGTTKIEKLDSTIERTRLGVHVSIEGQAADAVREVGDLTGNALEGVTTELDGAKVEPFALVDVKPGDHVVKVVADGYFPVEKKHRAVQGATALVEIELKPRPATVTVKTDDGARIAVDGRAMSGSTFDIAAGTHLLTITRSGREPFGRELFLTRGQALKLDAPLEKTAKRRAVPYVIGGAAILGAAAITSTIVAVVHDSKASDLDDEIQRGNADPSKGDDYDRQIAKRDDWKTGAYVFGGAAVVAGTVGFLLYAFDSPSAESVRIAPTASPDGAGVAASGRF